MSATLVPFAVTKHHDQRQLRNHLIGLSYRGSESLMAAKTGAEHSSQTQAGGKEMWSS